MSLHLGCPCTPENHNHTGAHEPPSLGYRRPHGARRALGGQGREVCRDRTPLPGPQVALLSKGTERARYQRRGGATQMVFGVSFSSQGGCRQVGPVAGPLIGFVMRPWPHRGPLGRTEEPGRWAPCPSDLWWRPREHGMAVRTGTLATASWKWGAGRREGWGVLGPRGERGSVRAPRGAELRGAGRGCGEGAGQDASGAGRRGVGVPGRAVGRGCGERRAALPVTHRVPGVCIHLAGVPRSRGARR